MDVGEFLRRGLTRRLLAMRKALWCARRRKPLPRWGLTRRLRRGKRACSPMGRSIALGGDPKGVQGGERKALLLAALGNNFAVSKSPGGE
mgnify:CR=1 FL=1